MEQTWNGVDCYALANPAYAYDTIVEIEANIERVCQRFINSLDRRGTSIADLLLAYKGIPNCGCSDYVGYLLDLEECYTPELLLWELYRTTKLVLNAEARTILQSTLMLTGTLKTNTASPLIVDTDTEPQ